MKSEKNLNERGTEIRSKYICTMHIVYIMRSILNHYFTTNKNFIECHEIWSRDVN